METKERGRKVPKAPNLGFQKFHPEIKINPTNIEYGQQI